MKYKLDFIMKNDRRLKKKRLLFCMKNICVIQNILFSYYKFCSSSARKVESCEIGVLFLTLNKTNKQIKQSISLFNLFIE